MSTFRSLRWSVAVFALLLACALVLARMSTSQVASSVRSELDTILKLVPEAHFAYMGARIGAGMQIVQLAEDPSLFSPEMLYQAASANVSYLSGIAAFHLRGRTGDPIWTVPAAAEQVGLSEPLALLQQASDRDPDTLATVVVDVAPWGRTLFLRFPVTAPSSGDSSVLIEALLLAPLYETLFSQDLRQRFDFEVQDSRGVLYADIDEPWPDSPFMASRTFPVAGHVWTVRVWPHRSIVLGRLRDVWWMVVCGGLVNAFGVASLVTLILWRREVMSREIVLAEARLQDVVQAAREMIVSMTAEGIVTHANPAAASLTGIPLERLVGTSLISLVARESAGEIERILAVAPDGVSPQARIDFQLPDGGRRSVEAIASRRQKARGRDRVDLVAHDLTAHKQVEAALIAARDQALETANMKAQFLANMSHELRTPMNGIFGMIDLLLETELIAEQREFAETVRRCAGNLLTIIDQVLDFSKLEVGKMELESVDVEVAAIVDDAVIVLAPRAAIKGLELVACVEPDVPRTVRGDPGKLRQVLVNLIGNAVKFTDEGEVVVRVSLEDGSDASVTLRFSVRDTGIGIPAHSMHRLFKSFSQVDGSMTRQHEGTGLGLAISQRLVELMGGKIDVESGEECGSTFWFAMPFVARDAPTMRIAPAAMQGVHVMIVDDNQTSRRMLQQRVVSWGMRSRVAASGIEALALLKEAARAGDPCRVALLDMQMPCVDGFRLARAIRDDPNLNATLLVLLTPTASVHESDGDELFAAYVKKPVREGHLLECLERVLAESAGRPGGTCQSLASGAGI